MLGEVANEGERGTSSGVAAEGEETADVEGGLGPFVNLVKGVVVVGLFKFATTPVGAPWGMTTAVEVMGMDEEGKEAARGTEIPLIWAPAPAIVQSCCQTAVCHGKGQVGAHGNPWSSLGNVE